MCFTSRREPVTPGTACAQRQSQISTHTSLSRLVYNMRAAKPLSLAELFNNMDKKSAHRRHYMLYGYRYYHDNNNIMLCLTVCVLTI